jgi:hypothetical protein
MNIRKIKLALSVGLMNSEPGNTLQVIKEQMHTFKGEVGNFLGLREVNNNLLNRNHVKRDLCHALRKLHAECRSGNQPQN